ncbi:MAG: redoxin domain-containing protein [Pirellulaceae bacterium]
MPDEIHNYAHNNEWLVRNLSFIGRVEDGLDLACNLSEMPRHPKVNTIDGRGSTGMGRQRLYDLLAEHRLWERTLELADTRYLEPQDDERREVERLVLVGSAAAMTGEAERLGGVRSDLEQRLEKVRGEREAAIASALETFDQQNPPVEQEPPAESEAEAPMESNKPATESSAETEPAPAEEPREQRREKAEKEAAKPFDERIKRFERALQALEGFVAWRQADFAKAHELLHDLNDVHESIRAEVQTLAGETEEGLKKLADQVERRPGQVIPRAVRAWTLAELGRADEAREVLEDLRGTSSCFDLDAPLIARLQPLVAAAGWPEDWRLEKAPAEDLGPRPDLASLGPFRWTPPAAPHWTLTDATGAEVCSAQWQGRPVVVIFYLGAGCLHCVEQLKAFAPERDKFLENGFDLIAISCEDEESLARSIKDYGESMPIPLVADPELTAFRAFRCFDDFEKTPLHGTFVIDGAGRIRWRDIGPEPFMDPKFVLDEALRLISFDASAPTASPDITPSTPTTE